MEQHGNPSKRKQPPTPSAERPMKQIKQETDALPLNGAHAPTTPNTDDMDDAHSDYSLEELEVPAAAHIVGAVHDTAEWQKTIEGVVKSVVSIHFCQTCSFDTDAAVSSEATGFVVDAEKGYILTNRHVVGAGPFIGYCIFDNHEECDVHPVYRDPVHDFGILRFDPKAIKYMPVTALQLRPDFAKVGVEIRVVGNDAGEKLSILSGVISRLDRNAPEYGEGYSDFNTNYIQAAAAASGGSSGSPVVNRDGFAVALQAGGRADGAATDYFLPLDRPLRALELIRQGTPVSRGTIQTQWILKPFDECRRLGLSPELEKAIRTQFPKETGMLVAEVVLPQGPASTKVEEGDLLLKVNGELLTSFVRLDSILDDNVGNTISVTIQRAGENMDVELDVGNLHDITPDRFVSIAGASFHDLSYQQARLYAISLKNAGVFVCEAAGSFRFADGYASGWLIHEVDNQPTPNLAAFVEVMRNIPDRKRIVIMYKHLRDLHTANTSITAIDRHWHAKIRIATRNDTTGLWDFKPLADPIPAVPAVPRRANFVTLNSASYPNAVDIVRSFVRVNVSMPIKLDGFPKMNKQGYGLVVDAEQGLVLVSRAILPYDLCDIALIIADSIFVDGKVIFMHPLQNYAIIKYDPSLVNAPVKTPKFATEFIKKGDETIFFGLNQNFRPVVAKTVVTDITTVAIPASAITPRYRATNFDAITVDTNQASHSGSGVLVAEDGTVQALWLSYLGERTSHSGKDVEYHLGLATPNLLPILNEIKSGKTPKLRILNVEFQTVQMSQARVMGVSEEWIEKTEQADPERHQLFMVRKVDSGHGDGLLEGDVLLTLNGKLVTRSPDLDVMYNNEFLDAIVVRKREEKVIKVSTVATEDLETDRMVSFCGATFHRPHQAVRQQISKIHSDVYISSRARGSPAYMYGLAPTNFLTHVNNVPTPNLDTFLTEVKKIADNEYFRLKVMTFDNVPWVATMKKNEHYFPTIEYKKDSAEPLGWKKIIHECEAGGAREVDEAAAEGDVCEE
ncbi:trypsin-like serine protease [Dothidotthia symphoricarpi CBS 119687]|uniref:Pro-apoptotic serine protease NMA111 n=1 Tax=Dothidotthia symphoricarpi CBS 119687 TaxID=1392245 RepID=A0A6A6AVV0_9PLEO|nr:trypsin-like serine protease [Dothidotthia symphoricarpi CBS 119687]KAF2134651.1 trypsin-like serine protease [Dothidotthia symphoricarpi CBS 119687]